eukprot:GEMP01035203.1.p1 GENE.GEMP01035203.1~~GEMP01035203.1.p1  ORF type:complete len:328 (+),score=77.02 GEMP01035203.1:72-1055(+)
MGSRTKHNLERWKKLREKSRNNGWKGAKYLKKGKDFDFPIAEKSGNENKQEAKKLLRASRQVLKDARTETKTRQALKKVSGDIILPGSLTDRLTLTGPLTFVDRKLRRTGQLSWHWLRQSAAAESTTARGLQSWPPASVRDVLFYLDAKDPRTLTARIESRFGRLKRRFVDQEVRPIDGLFNLPRFEVPGRDEAPESGVENIVRWASVWAFVARFVACCPLQRVLDGLAYSIGSPTKGEIDEVVVGEYSPAQVVLLVAKSWTSGKTCVVKRRRGNGAFEILWDSAEQRVPAIAMEPAHEEVTWGNEDSIVHWGVSDDEEMSEGSFFE